jgi:dTDP-4-dehydrorhamnose 3,5-epimerase-like enzyme
MSPIDDCKIIDLPRITNRRGNITPVEGVQHIPFEIERVFYLYDVPGGTVRGGHAHKSLQQILISTLGAFDVKLDDGKNRRTVHLDRAYFGLYIPPMIWNELANFSSGAICLVLASLPYDERDYFRDYNDFLANLRKDQ